MIIALASTLSTGPVGVGDGIGFSDVSLIMRLVILVMSDMALMVDRIQNMVHFMACENVKTC